MLPGKQWLILRPRWASLLAAMIGTGSVLSLGYVSLYTVPLALLVLWRFRYHRLLGLKERGGLLYMDNSGRWEFVSADSRTPLLLCHIWRGFAWTTLRFCNLAATNPGDSMLELTVWKSSVSSEAWRQLCVQLACQTAQPDQAVAQEA